MGISGIGNGAGLWKGLADSGLAGISGSLGTGTQGIGQSGTGTFGLSDATGAAEAAGNAKNSAADKAFADVLQKAYDEKDKKELKKVCQQFESIMMSMMYKQMKATVPSTETAGDSQAREIYQGMLDEELMTRVGSRGIGLADILFKQLSHQMDMTVKAGTETVDPTIPTTAEPVIPAAAEPVIPAAAEPVIPTTAEPVIPTTAEPALPTYEDLP